MLLQYSIGYCHYGVESEFGVYCCCGTRDCSNFSFRNVKQPCIVQLCGANSGNLPHVGQGRKHLAMLCILKKQMLNYCPNKLQNSWRLGISLFQQRLDSYTFVV
ncbi:hypothetical protein OIU84_003422 [Salix udensis]|uniref:Uncharacterized protein n=1 Tax=Salix udensis TaxID=889485 RepID=A0AAD6P2U0_9ROSI|nr:hypothetical protein OIU84_003422 [Salix udensis]